jgi:alpha-glucoside transport system substrate-binding protein
VFPFPPAKAGGDNPVEGGGDLAGLFSGNNDAAKTILKYMTSQGFGAEAAKGGTFLSPRKDFPMNNYPNTITQEIAKIAYTSTVIAFDGSDQMPGAVGSGTFWREMTSWISGQTSQANALKAIDTSWPKS